MRIPARLAAWVPATLRHGGGGRGSRSRSVLDTKLGSVSDILWTKGLSPIVLLVIPMGYTGVMSDWTVVSATAVGQIVVGRFESLELAEARVEQVLAAAATNPFPQPVLSIEPPRS